ncbi:MAG: hypothetical protein LBV60_13805, partial [Streptomyces sp.]|nr:hypothetical protein [Streptomyces sp.]
MTTHLTEQDTLADQAAALTVLAAIAARNPGLPAAYFIVHEPAPHWAPYIAVLCDSPGAFELWRTALAIPPAATTLTQNTARAWMYAACELNGVTLQLTGNGIDRTAEQIAEP